MKCQKEECTQEATLKAETLFGVMRFCTRHGNKMKNNIGVRNITKIKEEPNEQ